MRPSTFRLPSAFSLQPSAFLYLLLFLALSLAWLWPVPARLTSRIAYDAGDPVLNAWILWWNAQAVPFTERWWNAPIFYPMHGALALSEHLFGIAVYTTPLQLAGLNAIGAYNVALIVSGWLCGFFAFLLGRRLTGSAIAGVIAGVAFALAPFRATHLSHLQVLTAQWMPAALFAMHAYLDDRRARWLALFACAWLLQALSNGYFLLFFPVLIVLWMLWFVRWPADRRAGLALAGTFALSSVLLLPSLLKYREVHEVMGLSRQRGEMVLFSADPASLLRMHHLLKFWPYVDAKTQEAFLFPGVTPVLLTIAAVVAAARSTGVRRAVATRSPLLFYAVATLLMWWLAFGPAPEERPLQALTRPYTLLALLPGFSGLRAPSRFAMVGALTLSIAGALAFQRLVPARRGIRATAAALVLAGLFVDGWIDAVPTVAPAPRVALPQVRDAAVLELPVEEGDVSTTAMFRMLTHGRPLVSGYSGHTPAHLRILASALRRDDPSAVLGFAEGRPLIIVVNGRYDAEGTLERFVQSLPGIQEYGGSAAGLVFLLPPQPKPRLAPSGPRLQPASVDVEERHHAVFDLGSPQVVRLVTFPLRRHYELLHPRLEVETSLDRTTWTSVWFGWSGGLAVAGALEHAREIPIRIQLPDVRARYIRIHPAQIWMIRELSIHAPR